MLTLTRTTKITLHCLAAVAVLTASLAIGGIFGLALAAGYGVTLAGSGLRI